MAPPCSRDKYQGYTGTRHQSAPINLWQQRKREERAQSAQREEQREEEQNSKKRPGPDDHEQHDAKKTKIHRRASGDPMAAVGQAEASFRRRSLDPSVRMLHCQTSSKRSYRSREKVETMTNFEDQVLKPVATDAVGIEASSRRKGHEPSLRKHGLDVFINKSRSGESFEPMDGVELTVSVEEETPSQRQSHKPSYRKHGLDFTNKSLSGDKSDSSASADVEEGEPTQNVDVEVPSPSHVSRGSSLRKGGAGSIKKPRRTLQEIDTRGNIEIVAARSMVTEVDELRPRKLEGITKKLKRKTWHANRAGNVEVMMSSTSGGVSSRTAGLIDAWSKRSTVRSSQFSAAGRYGLRTQSSRYYVEEGVQKEKEEKTEPKPRFTRSRKSTGQMHHHSSRDCVEEGAQKEKEEQTEPKPQVTRSRKSTGQMNHHSSLGCAEEGIQKEKEQQTEPKPQVTRSCESTGQMHHHSSRDCVEEGAQKEKEEQTEDKPQVTRSHNSTEQVINQKHPKDKLGRCSLGLERGRAFVEQCDIDEQKEEKMRQRISNQHQPTHHTTKNEIDLLRQRIDARHNKSTSHGTIHQRTDPSVSDCAGLRLKSSMDQSEENTDRRDLSKQQQCAPTSNKTQIDSPSIKGPTSRSSSPLPMNRSSSKDFHDLNTSSSKSSHNTRRSSLTECSGRYSSMLQLLRDKVGPDQSGDIKGSQEQNHKVSEQQHISESNSHKSTEQDEQGATFTPTKDSSAIGRTGLRSKNNSGDPADQCVEQNASGKTGLHSKISRDPADQCFNQNASRKPGLHSKISRDPADQCIEQNASGKTGLHSKISRDPADQCVE